MNFINFENPETFWNLFDKVFNRENITGISFISEDNVATADAVISSHGRDSEDLPIDSTLEIDFDDEENGYIVHLKIGAVRYHTEYYIPSKVLSEKLGANLWRAVRKQIRSGR